MQVGLYHHQKEIRLGKEVLHLPKFSSGVWRVVSEGIKKKLIPIYFQLQKHTKLFNTKICLTGQHRTMLDQVLSLFGVQPDFDLNIMRPNQDLFDISAAVLNGLKAVFLQYKPDLVLVQGDTTTTFISSLAAFFFSD